MKIKVFSVSELRFKSQEDFYMIYGYARVSTAGQSINGNSLEDQTRALQNYGCQEIVTETFTGKSMERPAFSEVGTGGYFGSHKAGSLRKNHN